MKRNGVCRGVAGVWSFGGLSWAWVACLVCFVAVSAGPGWMAGGVRGAAAQAGGRAPAAEELDTLILKSGVVVTGRFISETTSTIEFEVVVGSISASRTYKKSDVLEVKRAARSGGGGGAGEAPNGGGASGAGSVTPAASEDELRRRLRGEAAVSGRVSGGGAGPTVYTMRLDGWFGTDISVPVVEEILADAKKYEPDYLVIEVDRRWEIQTIEVNNQTRLLGIFGDSEEASSAFPIIDLFTKELPRTWSKRPHIVVWVKTAMGGAAFLPFMADTILFHPEGRMGGIGTLGELLEGRGDKVAIQKQRSLRLARAQGVAIAGGYDPRIVDAMMIQEKELSYRLVGGRAELIEGPAVRTNEYTLTVNGLELGPPSVEDALRGNIPHTLNLTAETALLLGISSGTAESLDDVLAELGILRSHVKLDGKAEGIMDRWQERLDRMARDLPREWVEIFNPPPGQAPADPAGVLGREIRLIEEIRATMRRFGDVLRFPEDFGATPPIATGIPDDATLGNLLLDRHVQLILLNN